MTNRSPSGASPSQGSTDQATSLTLGERERRQLTGRAGIVAAGTLASRLLGLVRDQVLAAVFSRAATDAFFVAFTIPNVLRQLLAEGAVQNAVLPVLATTKEHQGDDAARRFFASVRGLSLLVLLAVTVLGVVFAPALVSLFAAGYRDVPGQFERTVTLTRWVFPYIFFMGTAALGVAALNTHQRFVATSFAPALLNVAFVICAVALPAWLVARGRDPILAMAAGALAGGALQVLAQWPSLRKIGYLARPRFEFNHPGVREVLVRMGPALFGMGVYAIDVTLARRLLSELPVGSQSYFAFAQRLCDFPQGIFVMALQSATLPSLARLAARGEHEEVAKTFAFGLRLALFVGIGATALFVGLSETLVAAIFQRGQFDARSTAETARALSAQGVGIWMVAATRQLVGAYYATGDTRTPVLVAAIDLSVFVAVALTLREPLGHVGVSVAVTAASFVQMLLLWRGLSRRMPHFGTAAVLRSAGKTLASALVAVVLARGALALWQPTGAAARILLALLATLVFGVVFLGFASLLGSAELGAVTAGLRRRRRPS